MRNYHFCFSPYIDTDCQIDRKSFVFFFYWGGVIILGRGSSLVFPIIVEIIITKPKNKTVNIDLKQRCNRPVEKLWHNESLQN